MPTIQQAACRLNITEKDTMIAVGCEARDPPSIDDVVALLEAELASLD